MSQHDRLVQEAEEAINAVFGDKSVSQQQTIDSLENLQDLISTSIEAIKSDVARDTGDLGDET